MEEWHLPQVNMLPIINMDYRTSEWSTSGSIGDIFGFKKLPYSCIDSEGMCHSSKCPPYIQVCHCTRQLPQASPCISTTSGKKRMKKPGCETSWHNFHTRFHWSTHEALKVFIESILSSNVHKPYNFTEIQWNP